MIKLYRSFLSFLFVVGCVSTQAQTLTENFESNSLPQGWNNSYQQELGNSWAFVDGEAIISNQTSLTNSAGPSWLISPGFVPKAGQGTLVFDLKFSASAPVGASTFMVRITSGSSTDYAAYNTLLTLERNVLSPNEGAVEQRVKIPTGFWGTECRVAFVQSVNGMATTDGASIDNIRLETDVYYAVGSGNSSEAIWAEKQTGILSTANFNANSSIFVQTGTNVILDKDLELINITIDPQAVLKSTGTSLVVRGSITSKGAMMLRTSEVRFNGDSRQYLDGNIMIGDITEDNLSGIEIIGGELKLTGQLNFIQGTFYTGNRLTLFSDQISTGSIGDLTSGSIVGDVNIQRYVPAGQTDWRFLSSPMINKTLNDINDDMVTSGFPGSDKPSFPFITAYSYQESRNGGIEAGFVAATDISNPLSSGYGYYIYCGDSLQSTGAFVLDMKGVVNQGNVYIPLTYTQTTNVEANGFNLIGNPYPSAINFNSLDKGSIEDNYWIYDPVSGNMDMWNEKAQIGLIKTDGNISSMQGFMVRASNSGAYVYAQEKDKVSKAEGLFLKAPSNKSYLSLKLKQASGKFYDVAVVNISSGSTKQVDGFDAVKVNISNPDAPKLAVLAGATELGISSVSDISINDTIPLLIKGRKTGTHILSLDATKNFDTYYVILLNTVTGERYRVNSDLGVSLELTKNGVNTDYVLVFEEKESFSKKQSKCFGDGIGYLAAKGPGNGPWTYTWKNSSGVVVSEVFTNTADSLKSPLNGDYTVTVSCAQYENKVYSFTVQNPIEITVQASVKNETCPQNNDASVSITTNGGSGSLKALWSNGSNQFSLQGLQSGKYTIIISDSLGCERQADVYITEPDTLKAGIVNLADTVYRGDTVRFESITNIPVNGYQWNFGDGFVSVNERPEHVYFNVGTFTIQLRTSTEYCSATTERTIFVKEKSGTGIADKELNENCLLQIKGSRLYVLPDKDYDRMTVHSIDGKEITTLFNLKSKELKEVITDTCSSGIYVVTLMVGEKASMRKIRFN